MTKPAKPLPRFRTEAKERAFWETEGRDSTQHLDWAKAQRVVLPNLKPSTKPSRCACRSTCSMPSRRRPTRAMCPTSR